MQPATTQLDLDTPFMQAHIADGVGWMTFNNPDRRNAMKLEMNHAVAQILNHFDTSDDVRVVVMSGAATRHSSLEPTSPSSTRIAPHPTAETISKPHGRRPTRRSPRSRNL